MAAYGGGLGSLGTYSIRGQNSSRSPRKSLGPITPRGGKLHPNPPRGGKAGKGKGSRPRAAPEGRVLTPPPLASLFHQQQGIRPEIQAQLEAEQRERERLAAKPVTVEKATLTYPAPDEAYRRAEQESLQSRHEQELKALKRMAHSRVSGMLKWCEEHLLTSEERERLLVEQLWERGARVLCLQSQVGICRTLMKVQDRETNQTKSSLSRATKEITELKQQRADSLEYQRKALLGLEVRLRDWIAEMERHSHEALTQHHNVLRTNIQLNRIKDAQPPPSAVGKELQRRRAVNHWRELTENEHQEALRQCVVNQGEARLGILQQEDVKRHTLQLHFDFRMQRSYINTMSAQLLEPVLLRHYIEEQEQLARTNIYMRAEIDTLIMKTTQDFGNVHVVQLDDCPFENSKDCPFAGQLWIQHKEQQPLQNILGEDTFQEEFRLRRDKLMGYPVSSLGGKGYSRSIQSYAMFNTPQKHIPTTTAHTTTVEVTKTATMVPESPKAARWRPAETLSQKLGEQLAKQQHASINVVRNNNSNVTDDCGNQKQAEVRTGVVGFTEYHLD